MRKIEAVVTSSIHFNFARVELLHEKTYKLLSDYVSRVTVISHEEDCRCRPCQFYHVYRDAARSRLNFYNECYKRIQLTSHSSKSQIMMYHKLFRQLNKSRKEEGKELINIGRIPCGYMYEILKYQIQ